jgi:hypothetical protein
MKREPITLGDKLALVEPKHPRLNFGAWLLNIIYTLLNISLLTVISALPWVLMRPEMNRTIMLVLLAAPIAFEQQQKLKLQGV